MPMVLLVSLWAGLGCTSGSEEPAGRWRERRALPQPDAADEALAALGYQAGYVETNGASGVQHTAGALPFDALLYTSGHDTEALVIDGSGALLHRWAVPFATLFPDAPAAALPTEWELDSRHYYRRARLLPDGDLLVIFTGFGIARLAPDGDVRWARQNGAHHDVRVEPGSGRLVVLTRRIHDMPWWRAERTFEDRLEWLDAATGEVSRTLSIPDALRSSAYSALLQRGAPGIDPLHPNGIFPLDAVSAAAIPGARAGQLLLSLRDVDALIVLDPEREQVVWSLSGLFRKQHDPSVVEGEIVVFDNQGGELGQHSRLLKIDAGSQSVRWSWPEDPGLGFYTEYCGTVQALSDGSLLAAETGPGRGWVIGPDREVQWLWQTPHVTGDDASLVASLFMLEAVDWPPTTAR